MKKSERGGLKKNPVARHDSAWGSALSRRIAGDTTRQGIGVLIADSARMPLAPFYGHMGMPLEQRVELLPNLSVRDRSPACVLVGRNALPPIVSPDHAISIAALNDMNSIGPKRDRMRWRLGGDPRHGVQDGEDFERIVGCTGRFARGRMDLVACFMNDESPPSGAGGIVEGAIGEDVKRVRHEEGV